MVPLAHGSLCYVLDSGIPFTTGPGNIRVFFHFLLPHLPAFKLVTDKTFGIADFHFHKSE